MKCHYCKRELPNEARFCLHCGAKLEVDNSTIECPNPQCRHQIPSDSKFCPDCGNPIKVTYEGGSSSSEYVTDPLELMVGDVRFKMIHVEGGTFQMGATPEIKDTYDDEKPVHDVTLSSYLIGETPVTQALWKAVMGSNRSHSHGDNLPVENVSWYDCQEFIKELNAKTCKKFRLPTEAEWEFAARGGNKSKHTQYSGSNNIDEVAWYEENCGYKTHPVKTKKANELGIYDMCGNVWEWCQDWWGGYRGSPQTNPTGSDRGHLRVIRGGSWFFIARFCRLSHRSNFTPDTRATTLASALPSPSNNFFLWVFHSF